MYERGFLFKFFLRFVLSLSCLFFFEESSPSSGFRDGNNTLEQTDQKKEERRRKMLSCKEEFDNFSKKLTPEDIPIKHHSVSRKSSCRKIYFFKINTLSGKSRCSMYAIIWQNWGVRVREVLKTRDKYRGDEHWTRVMIFFSFRAIKRRTRLGKYVFMCGRSRLNTPIFKTCAPLVSPNLGSIS